MSLLAPFLNAISPFFRQNQAQQTLDQQRAIFLRILALKEALSQLRNNPSLFEKESNRTHHLSQLDVAQRPAHVCGSWKDFLTYHKDNANQVNSLLIRFLASAVKTNFYVLYRDVSRNGVNHVFCLGPIGAHRKAEAREACVHLPVILIRDLNPVNKGQYIFKPVDDTCTYLNQTGSTAPMLCPTSGFAGLRDQTAFALPVG